MSKYPKVQLSRLREIGWDEWDPIGIRTPDGDDAWKTNAADEYDAYLLHVVSLLQRGHAAEEAVAYLDWVCSEHMGLGPLAPEAHQASKATVEAISEYLETLPH